ncbi:MAG: CotH kinase family protein [Anaerolineae bacterium]|nr:CotH kinase family protein [Anaerolineae bacterium]
MVSLDQFKKSGVRIFLLGLLLALSVGVGLSPGASVVFAQEGTAPESSEEAATQAGEASESEPVVFPETIVFSHNAMVTNQPFVLTLTNLTGGTIRYTTNGSFPIAANAPYTGPITINESTVIRAQVFNNDGTPAGYPYTRSYIVANYEQTIPVISLVSDWVHFDTLHNAPQERGEEWERPVTMEYFAPGGHEEFNVNAGIRIHGGKSRWYSYKKSYRIYFNKKYGGPGNLEYPLFEDSPVTKFDKLVLRAGYNDSFVYRDEDGALGNQAFTAKYIGDQVTRNLHRNMGQPIAHGRWVLVYLNGQFWGLYNLTERIDLQMLRSYSSKDAEWDVIVKSRYYNEEGLWIDQEEVRDGGYGSWLENQNWVGSADFSNPGNIGGLEWRVDLENLFSYTFLEAYVQNYDWPRSNWAAYRRWDPEAYGSDAQWRFMVWDAEYSFGGGPQGFKTDLNTLVNAYSPHDSITRLMEKPMIGFCGFKHRFVDRAREYLGVENKYGKPPTEVGQLSKENIKAEILTQAEIVRPFIPMETARWAPDLPGPQLFEQNVQNMLRFVDEREEVILHHLDILRYQTFTECK